MLFAGAWTAPALAGSSILVLGDSISAAYGIQREQGWVALLEERVAPEGHQVINASISGETTGGGLARLPGALKQHDPDVVIVELGGNDGLRGYPTSRMRANLEAIIIQVKESGATPLLVGMQIPPNYGPRYTRAFRNTFETLAEQHDLPFVPFFLENVALEGGLMQRDGIHPTAEAQGLLLDTIWPELEPLLALGSAGRIR